MIKQSAFNKPLIDPIQVELALNIAYPKKKKFSAIHNLILLACFCYFSGLLVQIPGLVKNYVDQRRELSFLGTPMESINIKPITEADYVGELTVSEKRELSALIHYVADEIIVPNSRTKVEDPYRLAFNIVTESLIAGEDPFFVSSVILAESNFDKNARSKVGALGLMQIMPHTGKYISDKLAMGWSGKDSLREPERNIRLGVAYIKYLKANFNNDLHKTLLAYNWGPGNVNKHINKAPAESQKYSKKIRNLSGKFEQDFKTNKEKFIYRTLTI